MITTKKLRKVPAHVTACAISAITHAACARTVIEFTRERGYTPAELVAVGAWIEVER